MSQTEAKASQKLPDLYALLGVPPLESDPETIGNALGRLAQKVQAAGEDAAPQMRRVFELGKTYLLDPKRKAAYDAKWRSVYGGAPTDDAAPPSGSDRVNAPPAAASPGADEASALASLERLLPDGDPTEPFDLATYLESQPLGMPAEAEEDDYATLAAVVIGTSPSPTTAVSTPPMAMPKAGPAQRPATAGGGAVPLGSAPQTKSLAKKIRRKRDRSLLLAIGGVLLSLAAVLGALLVLLNRETESPESSQPPAAQAPPPTPEPQAPTGPAPPTRSGLAAPPGLESFSPPSDPPPDLPGMSNPMAADTPAAPTDDAATAVPPPSTPEPTMPSAGPPETMTPEPSPETTPPGPDPTAQAPPRPRPLTDEEKAAWKATMTEIRQLLAQQKYIDAKEKLEAAADMAVTSEQVDQLTRLKRLAELAEEFYNAMLAAINSLGSGEVFTAGASTPISFIEGSKDFLAVRVLGKNQRYALTEVPLGVAFGLAALKMDAGQPVAAARQAAFAVLHPSTKPLGLQRARSLMQEAVAAEVVPEHMMQVFEDDYSL